MFLIFGSKYIYRGIFKFLDNGRRKFKIVESFDIKHDLRCELSRVSHDEDVILSPYDEANSSNFFGVFYEFGRYNPPLNYVRIFPFKRVVETHIIKETIEFDDFPMDDSLSVYIKFFRELLGIEKTNTEHFYMFCPGIKRHTIFQVSKKFDDVFSILRVSNFKVFENSELECSLDSIDNTFDVTATRDNFYWYKLRDSHHARNLIEPYTVKELTNYLVPRLQSLIDEQKILIDKNTSDQLLNELGKFSYRNDLAYESLDSFPALRALIFLAMPQYDYYSSVSISSLAYNQPTYDFGRSFNY